MKFKYLILEARTRKEVLEKMSSDGLQLFLHLIKILYFNDSIDANHYRNELNGRYKILLSLYETVDFEFDASTLKEVLMGRYKNNGTGYIIIPYDIDSTIKSKLKKYTHRKTIRTKDELLRCLNELYDIISQNLSLRKHIEMTNVIMPYLNDSQILKLKDQKRQK